jgi:hypothetical protein
VGGGRGEPADPGRNGGPVPGPAGRRAQGYLPRDLRVPHRPGLRRSQHLRLLAGTKEIVVEADPTHILHAINSRAITRLAVPVGGRRPFDFVWPELIAFEERTTTVIGYDPSGVTPHGDITIRSRSEHVERNTAGVLDVVPRMKAWQDSTEPDHRRWVGSVGLRLSAVTPGETQRATHAHHTNVRDGLTIETYLSTDVEHALQRLVA